MGNRYALIIANNEYSDRHFLKLETPAIDAKDLANILETIEYGAFDKVKVLINQTFSTVQLNISDFFADKRPDDLLFLYFSGHGALDRFGRLYLITHDSIHERPSGSAISSTFIHEEMNNSRSKRQVLLLDCCYSGAFSKGTKSIDKQQVITKNTFEGAGYGRVILTATDSTQYAWEGDQIIGKVNNSLFTHFFIEGIKTGDADLNNDGEISLDELYQYTYDKIDKATNLQKPQKWVYNQQGSPIVISKNPHSNSSINKTPNKNSVSKKKIHVLDWLGIPRQKKVVCPYCLTEIKYWKLINTCPNCKSNIPPVYLLNYENSTPLFLQFLGYTAVGKTIYLQSIIQQLSVMGFYWERFSYSPLTDSSMRFQSNVMYYAQTGVMANATQMVLQEAYIFQINNIGKWMNRILIFRDIAGEHFNNQVIDIKYTPYLLPTVTSIMMVSPYDEANRDFSGKMDQLMSTYLNTTAKHAHLYGNIKRNVIVSISKADLLIDRLPETIIKYLESDPFVNAHAAGNHVPPPQINMASYLKELNRISKEIESWLMSFPTGRNLISLASENDVTLRFCIFSALGNSPDMINKSLSFPTPVRVLDPLFWVMELMDEPLHLPKKIDK